MKPHPIVSQLPVQIRPDPSRVVIRPFMPADDPPAFAASDCTRAQRIANRVLGLSDTELHHELDRVSTGLADRHRNVGPCCCAASTK